MLPFDNKSEFQVILDFPEGRRSRPPTPRPAEVAAYLAHGAGRGEPQTYAGTAAPFNFNGLVRHYFLRRGANVADVQVNLLPKGDRHRQSHDIAVAVRPAVDSIARRYGASAKIAEIPPGPPVLCDAGGRDLRRRRQHPARGGAAGQGGVGVHADGVVDVDWTVEAPQAKLASSGWTGSAPPRRASRGAGGQVLTMALSGAGRRARQRRRRRARAWPSCRGCAWRRGAAVEALLAVPVATIAGAPAAGAVRHGGLHQPGDRRGYRKNLRPVIYVTGDVAGHRRVAGVRHPGDEPRARHASGWKAPTIRPVQRDRSRTGWTRPR